MTSTVTAAMFVDVIEHLFPVHSAQLGVYTCTTRAEYQCLYGDVVLLDLWTGLQVSRPMSMRSASACRAVFKRGGCGFNPPPPRNVEKKFVGNVEKHAQGNASADALYVCTMVMPGNGVR